MKRLHPRNSARYTVIFILLLMMCCTVAAASITYSPDGKGYRYEKDGWTYLHIEGTPYERGYQHRYLMAPEIPAERILRNIPLLFESDGS